MLRTFREFLSWRQGDAIILAEANVQPKTDMEYFGASGERMQMMFNFEVNQHLFYALATGDSRPLIKALKATKISEATAQWGQFLRNHDELDLGRLTDEQRQAVFAAFGPDKDMQLYERGIRRRLAPMLQGDRRRLELAYSLMMALPGTPVLRYGDEIGMGDNLRLPERNCARTPMQWSTEPQGGFTKSEKPILPVISGGAYGFEHVNVAQQRRDPDSLMNWMERMIRMRKEAPEIGWGEFSILQTRTPEVLAIRYDWRNNSVLVVHNLSAIPREVWLEVGVGRFRLPCESAIRREQQFRCVRQALSAARSLWIPLVPGRRSRLYPETKPNLNGHASVLPRQKDKIRQWAKANGVRIMQWFSDVLPGKTPLEDRPGMQAMLAALYSDGIKLVVIERLDRLSRKLTIQESAIAYIKKNGFEIISATEPDLFDDDPMRTAMRQMMGIFAELDAKMIALKLKAARTRAKTKDAKYREGRKAFEFRPGETETIARVMELYASGLKLPAITRQLNGEGQQDKGRRAVVSQSGFKHHQESQCSS